MEETASATLNHILLAAMEEFSDKGFLGASLRQIVKKAGVTTGAFYGYFSTKEALFAPLVNPMPPLLWESLWKPRPLLLNSRKNSSRNIWEWNPPIVSTGWWIISAGIANR